VFDRLEWDIVVSKLVEIPLNTRIKKNKRIREKVKENLYCFLHKKWVSLENKIWAEVLNQSA